MTTAYRLEAAFKQCHPTPRPAAVLTLQRNSFMAGATALLQIMTHHGNDDEILEDLMSELREFASALLLSKIAVGIFEDRTINEEDRS